MKPFVREAKQDFRDEAVPIVGEMNCMFRWVRKEGGRRDSWGPERGMEGRDQGFEDREGEDSFSLVVVLLLLSGCLSFSLFLSLLSLSLSFLWLGGGPMMPPSRNLMIIGGAGG